MKLSLTTVQDAGLVVRAVRRSSRIRIDDFALLSRVSKQFMTDLENGKPTIQMGRVLELLQQAGIRLTMEVPDSLEPVVLEETKRAQRARLRKAARGESTSPKGASSSDEGPGHA